jgi:hypothetical protein
LTYAYVKYITVSSIYYYNRHYNLISIVLSQS